MRIRLEKLRIKRLCYRRLYKDYKVFSDRYTMLINAYRVEKVIMSAFYLLEQK